MNEWQVNFSRKKKKKKKKKKNSNLRPKKKSYYPILLHFLKKNKNLVSPILEWMAYELFLGKKKNTGCVFFSEFFLWFRKKKTPISDLNEWMTNVHAREKKKYDTFDSMNIALHSPSLSTIR